MNSTVASIELIEDIVETIAGDSFGDFRSFDGDSWRLLFPVILREIVFCFQSKNKTKQCTIAVDRSTCTYSVFFGPNFLKNIFET